MKNALLVLSGVAMGLLAMSVLAGRDTLPRADAQGGGAGMANGQTILATGGSAQNQNDLCWVYTRVKPARGPERSVLALYRAKKNGDYFDLEDVRVIDADIRLIELEGRDHDPSFDKILKSLPKPEQDSIVPPRP